MADYGGFSQGGALDTARPSAGLAQVLDQAAGMDLRYRGLDDDQLTEAAVQHRAEQYRKAGMGGGMDKLRALAFTGKLTGRNPLGTRDPDGSDTAAPARVHLTAPEWILPLLTVLGLADNPGEAAGLGAIDPALVRQLAATAAASGRQTDTCRAKMENIASRISIIRNHSTGLTNSR
jgi:hypothetical protein